jgi:hypothetical protein
MELEFRRLLEATLQQLGRVSQDLDGRALERLSDRELAELYVLWLGMNLWLESYGTKGKRADLSEVIIADGWKIVREDEQ